LRLTPYSGRENIRYQKDKDITTVKNNFRPNKHMQLSELWTKLTDSLEEVLKCVYFLVLS
jgi:hypothetical protein